MKATNDSRGARTYGARIIAGGLLAGGLLGLLGLAMVSENRESAVKQVRKSSYGTS